MPTDPMEVQWGSGDLWDDEEFLRMDEDEDEEEGEGEQVFAKGKSRDDDDYDDEVEDKVWMDDIDDDDGLLEEERGIGGGEGASGFGGTGMFGGEGLNFEDLIGQINNGLSGAGEVSILISSH